MRAVIVTVLGAALASCDSMPQARAADDGPVAETGFPKPGEYHIVRDVTAGGATNRWESDSHVDASSRELLERLVAGGGGSLNCGDRRVDIGGGSFSVRETCSTMAIDTHGTYSKDSIDVAYDRTVAGVTRTDTASYRLKR